MAAALSAEEEQVGRGHFRSLSLSLSGFYYFPLKTVGRAAPGGGGAAAATGRRLRNSASSERKCSMDCVSAAAVAPQVAPPSLPLPAPRLREGAELPLLPLRPYIDPPLMAAALRCRKRRLGSAASR